jgi:hypothetical protein
VVSDVELDRATASTHGLFLVGTAADNRLLGELGKAFPIRVEQGALKVGRRTFSAPGTGAIFVHPNPLGRGRSLVVVTALDPAGIWQALALPQLLPDFLVYDASLAPAANEQILGSARVLAGGLFDYRWRLPADLGDAVGGIRRRVPQSLERDVITRQKFVESHGKALQKKGSWTNGVKLVRNILRFQ